MVKINNLEELNAYMEKNGKNLREADLSDAILVGADLSDAILVGADLSGADLRKANLREANLSDAILVGADLSGADLSGANLSWANLREADLRKANLRDADLSWANLSEADLGGADLRRANLSGSVMRGADLRDADLREANLDYSCWPLWCGSLKAQIDDRIAVQLLYHLCSTVLHSPEVGVDIKAVLLSQMVLDIANRFHRADECGKLELGKGMESRK